MFKKFFEKYPNYTIEEKPSEKIINKYKNSLPQEIIRFWKEYGFGTYIDGFLKFVNPEDYQEVFEEAYDNSMDNETVFAITAFGDFLGWDGGSIIAVRFRYGNYNYISTDDLEFFFEHLTDYTYIERVFFPENYLPAKKRLGNLAFDECYGYVPLLGLGGAEKPENIDKVKIREHILIIAMMMGQIE